MTVRNSNAVAYFGYGSLVNEFTWARRYESHPAELRGWVREWKHCVDAPFGRVCALTVSPHADGMIQGLFIICAREDLKAVDEREIGYERVEITRSAVVAANDLPDELYIYRSNPRYYREGSSEYPLLLSYVEVVMFGYLRAFGEAAVERFIETTTGWRTPFLDDRMNPIYPRAMQLPIDKRRLIEEKLRMMKGLEI